MKNNGTPISTNAVIIAEKLKFVIFLLKCELICIRTIQIIAKALKKSKYTILLLESLITFKKKSPKILYKIKERILEIWKLENV